MEHITAIFFSCRRLGLLAQTINAFIKFNTYPITEYIIVNDSGDEDIHIQLREEYGTMTLVSHPENMGLIKSIDLGYAHIKTNYFFHCEDDWMLIKDGLIQKSLVVMTDNANIEEVWPTDMNEHPIEPTVFETNGVSYRLVQDNYQKGMNGYNDFAWHGFTTAIGLKRMEDYRKVAPYSDIPWHGTIWHREQAIGEKYHQLGYRTVCLLDDYAINIGYGKSEYITGSER